MTGDPTLYTIKHPIAEMMAGRTAAEAPGRTETMTTPTPTPTPVPAASERMTAERIAEIRENVAAFVQRGALGDYADRDCLDLLALVDKQAVELAEAQRGAKNNWDARCEWRKYYEEGQALIRTLSARAEAAERELANLQEITGGILTRAALIARAEAAEARAETALDLLKQAEQRLVYWMAEASPNETAGDAQRTQTMIDTNPVIIAIRALLTAPPPTDRRAIRLLLGKGRVHPLATPPSPAFGFRGRVMETQQSIGAWADGVFGRDGVTPARQLARAFEELNELAIECVAAPDRLEECADVAICLIVYAHRSMITTPPLHPILQTAVDAKMAINRKRRWAIMGDGTGYHIPPPGGGGDT